MKTLSWSIVAALAPLFLAGGAWAADDSAADEAAIRANADKFVESYNRRDSHTLASLWSPEAVYMDRSNGESVIGQKAIEDLFNESFAGAGDNKLDVSIDSIDFVSPNVAIERGSALITSSDSEPVRSTYSAVHVKRDGKWYLDRVTETEDAPEPTSNYEHLKELEWLVGNWIDSDDQATIDTKIEWTKNRNFLRRSFAVVIGDQVNMSGMQIIGWDPAEKKIRSWVFDSDGGFCEATWTHKGDRWLIQNNGTLVDGRKSTALNILTYVDGDSFKWQSVNREVDVELLPNIDDVTVVRAPDTDSANATAAGN